MGGGVRSEGCAGSGWGWGGQGGCEQRIEFFVKIQKKELGGWVGGWVGGEASGWM